MVQPLTDPYKVAAIKQQQSNSIRNQDAFIKQKQEEMSNIQTERLKYIQEKSNKETEWAQKSDDIGYRDTQLSEQQNQIRRSNVPESYKKETIANIQVQRDALARESAKLNAEKKQYEQKIASTEQKLQSFSKQYLTSEGQQQVGQQIKKEQIFMTQRSAEERGKVSDIRTQAVKESLAKKQQQYQTTIKREQLQIGTEPKTSQQKETIITSTKGQTLGQTLEAMGYSKEDITNIFTGIESQKGAYQLVEIKGADKTTLEARPKDVLGGQADIIWEKATAREKALMSAQTFFSGSGIEYTAAGLVEGGKEPSDIVKENIKDAIKQDRKTFIVGQAGGSIFGSVPGVVGTSMLGGAGLTAIGGTAKGAALFGKPAVELGMKALGVVYVGGKGAQVYQARGDKEKLVEIGLRTGAELGGFFAGAKLQKGFMLKKEVGITKSGGIEQITERGEDTYKSVGTKKYETEYLGRKFTGEVKTETFGQKLDKPLVTDDFIIEGTSLTKGSVKTKMVSPKGKTTTTEFISGSKTSPKITGNKRLVQSTALVKGGKRFETYGVTKEIFRSPVDAFTIQASKSATAKPFILGRDVTIIKDIPKPTTDTFQIFGGGTKTVSTIKPAEVSIVTQPTSTATSSGKVFTTSVKSLVSSESFVSPSDVSIFTITQQKLDTKQKQVQDTFSISAQTQKQKQVFKTGFDMDSLSKTITTTKPISTTKTGTSLLTTPTTSITSISATKISPIAISGTIGSSITQPLPPIKPIFSTGSAPITFPSGFGRLKEPKKKRKIGKGKWGYTPSLSAAAYGITGKVGKGKKTYSGLTFRPLKQKSIKRFNLFKKEKPRKESKFMKVLGI